MNLLPPNDEESERGVLGCILLDRDCLDETIQLFPAGAQTFYVHAHGLIYTALLELHEERKPLDEITVQSKLKQMGKLEEVGGIGYISQLSDSVPSAANLAYYAESVKDKWMLRQAIKAGTNLVTMAYEESGDARAIIDQCGAEISSLGHPESKNQASMKKLVEDVVDYWEQKHLGGGEIAGLKTGFSDLDNMTDGLQPGDMVVIAGRPSMGKTGLALNIAENVAIDQRIPVGVLSLEMTNVSLVSRMLASRSKLNQRKIGRGVTQGEMQRVPLAAAKLVNAPIYIDDEAGINILQAKAKLRRMHQQHGIKLGVVDYLQLLNGTDTKAIREVQVSQCSKGIKELAKELKIPIIILAQLNRDIEKDKNRKPRLSDLRESGSIEQDADLAMFLYKPDDKEPDEGMPTPVNLFIAKQRNGETGEICLTFFKQFTRFEQAEKLRL